jgi:sulfur-carrier protein
MAVVTFTSNLDRHVECPPQRVAAANVGEALEAAFEGNARLRGYILDDQGRLRKHVLVLIDGVLIRDRDHLTDPITDSASIYVAQALSGG